jgi:hypothetical protein
MYGNLDHIEHRAERVVIILVGLIGAGKVRPPLLRVVRVVSLRSTLRSLYTKTSPSLHARVAPNDMT